MAFRKVLAGMVLCAGVLTGTTANAMFMDVTSVVATSNGSFTGQIGSVSVNGSLAGQDPLTRFTSTTFSQPWANSVIDGSSIQYSDSSIYTPSNPTGDQVGYAFVNSTGVELLTIQFSQALTNPVFHVGNLDSMVYDFSVMGLTRADLVLLSGNGGADGEGLFVDALAPILRDGNPDTVIGTDGSAPIPISGPRSGYGSVMLLGSFTTLQIELYHNPAQSFLGGDGGTFQISLPTPIPEPATLGLFSVGLLGVCFAARRRRRG